MTKPISRTTVVSNALVCAVALAAGTTRAAITATVGATGFGVLQATETFQSYSDFTVPGTPFGTPNGFTIDLKSSFYYYGCIIVPPTALIGMTSRCCYANGGVQGMMSISRTDTLDFDQLEFDLGNGIFANPEYVWLQAWNNGSPVAGFDLTVPAGGRITVQGGGYDEVRFAAYGSAIDLAAHDTTILTAPVIDNLQYGTSVPAPASAIIALGGLAAAQRPRRTV